MQSLKLAEKPSSQHMISNKLSQPEAAARRYFPFDATHPSCMHQNLLPLTVPLGKHDIVWNTLVS